MALRAAASAKDNRVRTTGAVRGATLHAGERRQIEPRSTRDDSWNIKASYCKSGTKSGQTCRLSACRWFTRLRIDEDNISETPPQEAVGGCWRDGMVMKYHRTGISGEQHGASQLDVVWLKPSVGLKRFQKLHVLPHVCTPLIWFVSENQKPASFDLVLIVQGRQLAKWIDRLIDTQTDRQIDR